LVGLWVGWKSGKEGPSDVEVFRHFPVVAFDLGGIEVFVFQRALALEEGAGAP